MIKINPYLSFDGNCEEAMNFYQKCFGGNLDFMRMKDSPMVDDFPEEKHNHIMHSELRNGDFVVMATDMQGPAGHQQGNDMSIILTFDDEAKMRKCFDALSTGATVFEPIRKQFWGDVYGELRDQFGKKWKMLLPKREN